MKNIKSIKVVPFDEANALPSTKHNNNEQIEKKKTYKKAIGISSIVLLGLVTLATAILVIIGAIGKTCVVT